MNHPPLFERLVDYLVLVGPGRGLVFNKPPPNGISNGPNNSLASSWHTVSRPVPTILRKFPAVPHKDFDLAPDVAYFCQPEGCCVVLPEPKIHVFMLTDTESNTRTYGICLSLPHLFDPLLRAQRWQHHSEEMCDLPEADSICIQEWGVLSVCLLTRHPFFHFFAKCLKTLAHFVDHFCGSNLTWNDLITAQYIDTPPGSPPARSAGSKWSAVREVEEWIGRLLALRSPECGENALEVELEVDPAVMVCYPPLNRFPLFDLPVHRVLRRLGVCTVIEIYKLVLSEQKVIIHSHDPSFVSECVLTIIALLYPLQYLFPVVPLLPTSMPTAENLLFVPTPFFIGVCSSFLDKLHDIHLDEITLVNLETKGITPPAHQDQPLLKFPFCILQLQADVRKALDMLERLDKLGERNTLGSTPGSNAPRHLQVADTPTSNSSDQSFVSPALGDDCFYSSIGHEVDVMVRVAFVDFLFCAEILGLIEQHLCVYRLFPRPVVALKRNAFLRAYGHASPATEPQFIRDFILSQCVEYFFEWSLNPTNFAFEEIRRGVCDVERLSDKHTYYVHKLALRIEQVCLYNPTPESILYQEMLSYKATQSLDHANSRDIPLDDDDDDDDSGWEFLSGDHYDGGSEISASSYFSDREQSPGSDFIFSPPGPPVPRSASDKALELMSDDDVAIGYCTPHRSSFPEAGSIQVLPYPVSSVISGQSKGARLSRRGSHERKGVRFEMKSFARDSDTDNIDSQEDDAGGYHTPYEGGGYHTPRLIDEGDTHSVPRSNRNTMIRRWQSYREPREREREVPPPILTPSHSTVPDISPPLITLRRSSLSMRVERQPAVRQGRVGPSPSSQALDNQIHDIVGKITSGQGFPWPKPASLKQMAGYEKTRVMLLRNLEEKLGLREKNDMVMSNNEQIPPVGVSRTVFKGLLELLKYLLQCVDEDLQKESEASIFSVFLILRIAFCVYLKQKQRSVIGLSFLGAFNLGSSILAGSGSNKDDGVTTSSSHEEDTVDCGDNKQTNDNVVGEGGGNLLAASQQAKDDVPDLLLSETNELKVEMTSTGSVTPTAQSEGDERSITPTSQGGGADSPKHQAIYSPDKISDPSPLRVQTITSSASPTPLADVRDSTHTAAPPPLISLTCDPSDHQIQTVGITPEDSPTDGREKAMQSTHSSPKPSPKPSPKHSPQTGNSPRPSRKTSPKSKQEPFLLADLIESPRFYHGEDLKNCLYLYKELVKSLGNTRTFLLDKNFWNALFIATIETDRNYLGWNEKTADMYTRYKSLTEAHRQAFGAEEDNLLSITLHDLLVYMLMVRLSATETTNLIHRFAARTRLATVEERLLQQTLKYVEQNATEEVELSCLSLMSLHSETHPTISYIVHYGVNVIAPVYKLQVTKEVLILRRFPDEKISSRLWNDCISETSVNEERATVSIKYRDIHGEYNHHFHTKQYLEVYDSLQELLPSSATQLL